MQDRNDFIWIGTEDGLVRFDGYSMLSFRKQHDNRASLSDNYISSLAESRDGRIWVGTMGGGLNVIQPQTNTVTRLQYLSSTDILDISLDPSADALWLGTNNGLYQLKIGAAKPEADDKEQNQQTYSLVQIPLTLPDGRAMNKAISGVEVLKDEIWFVTRGAGIGRYRPAEKSLTLFQAGSLGLEDNTFNTLTSDSSGNIWAGGQNRGLVLVERQGEMVRFSHYTKKRSGFSANDVMAITQADKNNLWVGTWNGGLALFNTITGKARLYLHNRDDRNSLASNIVMDILKGRNGQVWVGTYDRGFCWFNPAQPFHSYRATPDNDRGLPSNLIWSFASSKKKLWIGSAKGLGRFNLKTREYEDPGPIAPPTLWDAVRKDDIRALLADDTGMWIAARHEGLFRLTFASDRLTPITDLLEENATLTHPYIRLILKDSSGVLWLGATKGLNRFDPATNRLRTYLPDPNNMVSLPHPRIRALYEDSNKGIWVGTSDGLLLLDKQNDPLQVWKYEAGDPAQRILAGKGVRGVSEDSQGRIWIATEGGVSVYNRETGKVVILREQDGMPNNSAYSVIPVGHYMWISTLRGLARVDTENLQIESYDTTDGLPGNEFNFNAWHRLKDGRLTFGTLFGFTIFSPEAVPGPEQEDSPPPLWVYMSIPDQNSTPVPVPFGNDPVVVGWRNNRVTFEYSALNFGPSEAVLYDVFLRGIDRGWKSIGTRRRSEYTGLAPGKYTFQARARDRHGRWLIKSTPVVFTVQAPPWKTLPAYILYVVLIVGGILLTVFLYNRRLHERARLLKNLVARRTVALNQSNQTLADKNKQLDRLMSGRERLFRAVSHELRTPLTVVLSVVESVLNDDRGAMAKLPVAHQSALHLGRLLDSILELSRREEKVILGGTPFLARPAILEASFPYTQQAEEEGKKFILEPPEEDVRLSLPRETFIMMISNLLSNACKYTTSGATFSLQATARNGLVQIVVQDNGQGVARGKEEHIFDWFERGEAPAEINGWGIGLAFVREAAETAGGSVLLDNYNSDAGARFLLTLPIAEDVSDSVEVDADSRIMPLPASGKQVLYDPEKVRTVVLVEDDVNLLKLLPTLLPDHWICRTATTAEVGWALIVEKEPDLILTDLMLPGESGFDLTKRVKEDSRTAHIPVMILTALGDEEFRLAGLGLSADSFMGKPFDNRELVMRIQGLIANRERVFARAKYLVFGRQDTADTKGQAQVVSTEDAFLEKLHIALPPDVNLSMITLENAASRLAMSTRSFQREMQRIGISWREYKRLRKLRIAMDLLRNPANRIGTVAELAGYSSAAHFSKTFKEHTGQSPTEWRNNNHINCKLNR